MKLSAQFLGVACGFLALSAPVGARAGDFDPQGNFRFDPDAVAVEGFELVTLVPEEGFEVHDSAEALEGGRLGKLTSSQGRRSVGLGVDFPAIAGQYGARMWMRKGVVTAVLVASPTSDDAPPILATLSPTGRCTSDGWVEMRSASVSIDGSAVDHVYLSVRGRGEIDAIEIERTGSFEPSRSCLGAFDPVCDSEQFCHEGTCLDGAGYVPALPADAERDRVVDWMKARIRYFFGGHGTRERYMHEALEEMERMRAAVTPWAFWNHFSIAFRKLHDWHTRVSSLSSQLDRRRHLNVCFFEGLGDLSQDRWPTDPRYLDLLVSHVGGDRNLDLQAGDRLIAVDGIHPIDWARRLVNVDSGWWQSDDDSVNAEYALRMRGLIPAYATSFTIIRCHGEIACSGEPEIIRVQDLAVDEPDPGDQVNCDNRPFYHLTGSDVPDPVTHEVSLHVGLLEESSSTEKIYGMVWNYLWGPTMTPEFEDANALFRREARGVILDHRLGLGGTVDAPEAITKLVRPRFDIAIFPFSRPSAGFEGPVTEAEGRALFDRYSVHPQLTYTVGSSNPLTTIPVALLLQLDGSASDFLPFGMKGAPHVRIFGPHATAGAFSTFYQLYFWGGLSLQLAYGDTIAHDGRALIGHGVEPDEIVVPLQSDLVQGRDTIHERALAWVRSELAP